MAATSDLRYSVEDEEALMRTIWSPQIADNPEAFVMFIFPWGQKGTPLEHYKGPRTWQRKGLRRIAAHIRANKGVLDPKMLSRAIASGRGIGKSAFVAMIVIWMITCRVGSTTIVSANTEAQLNKVTWGELSKWVTMALHSHWWELTATRMSPAKWLSDLVERDLQKGTRYWAAEGKLWSAENPDGYAGVHNVDGMLVIFDEASGIDDSIWSVAGGFFTEKIVDRYWLAFSNPRRNTGYFFEIFHSKRDFWESEQIDARTIEDNDQARYDAIIAEFGEDSDEARVEVYGEFPKTDNDDQFIGPALVQQAMERPPWGDPSAPKILGIDPARGGADSTVLYLRQGRDTLLIKRIKSDDTMETVGEIILVMQEHRPVMTVIDEGGLGYGILDRLNEQGYKVRGVNFGWRARNQKMYVNKRAEMWGDAKAWLKTASIPNDKKLKDDLTGPRREPTSTGAIQLESKKHMKSRGLASPDSADALAVTFAFPVKYTDEDEAKIKKKAVYNVANYANNWMRS